ncbi:inter-alpha-trypsin inhibitor heavy chain H3-like isoform X2 [Asterias rubens]|uniref:inter-alpha-trypsin inhibitor heavy chain H3-like isoform X2 n=1 Tax=Asterias rubens TaxID=7604 RepID=UPI001455D24C|nr:inter-alpha-trypsin inhibitor heavy chain H3-like isoform X2 [Asterias rubens]
MFRHCVGVACVLIAALLSCLSNPADSAPNHLAILDEELESDDLINFETNLKRDERAAGCGSGSGSGSGSTSGSGAGTTGSGGGYVSTQTTHNVFTDIDTVQVTTRQPIIPLRIHRLHVTSSVTARFAKTVVTSHVVNPANQSQEVNFYSELPDEAFISGFLIEVDGNVYYSTVDEKEKAQKAYDDAKKRGQTAGQVKQTSEKKNDFTISINVEGGGTLSFNLTYEELLKRKNGYFENPIFISPGQPVEHLTVDVHINEPQGLDESKLEFFLEERPSSTGNHREVVRPHWAGIKQIYRDRVHVQFHPDRAEQKLVSPDGIMGRFIVRYDVIHGQNAGKIEIVNGYFVHHFSPDGFLPMRKNVVFVLDTSGSMGGFKERQMKEAMATILPDLREQDNFGIVFFETTTRSWKEHLVPACKSNIEDAAFAVNYVRARGGTNLHGGVMDSISLLEDAENNEISTTGVFSLIIMLTDGSPSAGITNFEAIKTSIRERLNGRYSLFCLGFGHNLNYEFLEQLSLQNSGLARTIYVEADAGLQLVGFYNEVATPLLSNIVIKYEDNLVEINSISQTLFPSYFSGTELVVAGKLAVGDDLPNVLTCVVTADTEGAQVLLQLDTDIKKESESVLSPHAVDDFAQRLWAFLTIKELLSKRIAADGSAEKASLTKRALDLSLKYHFVTPLTSLVVVKPEEVTAADVEILPPASAHETSSYVIPPPVSSKGRQGSPMLLPPPPFAPVAPVAPVTAHLSVDSDPHFMVHDTRDNLTVCFDIMGTPGDVISLVHDPILGIDVNGHLASPYRDYDLSTMPTPTIFDSLSMSLAGHQILINADIVNIRSTLSMKWEADWDASLDEGVHISARDQKYLTVRLGKGITLVVYRHDVARHHALKVDYFGLYIEDGEGFSRQVHGIIGQFERRELRLDMDSVTVDEDFQVKGYIKANNKRIEAIQSERRNLLTDIVWTCWYVDNDAYGLIDGNLTDYVVNK